MDSPVHGRPSRFGPLSSTQHTPLAEASIHSPPREDDGTDEDGVTVYAFDDIDDEGRGSSEDFDQELEAEAVEDEDEEEEVGHYYDDEDHEDHEDNEDSLDYAEPHEPTYFGDLDSYLLDDMDVSENAGVPLEYLVNALTNDMDVDSPAGSDGDFDPVAPDVAAMAHAAATAADAQEAAYEGMVTPVANILFGEFDPADAWTAHPFSLSNPNPAVIGPSNYGLTDFLRHWARQSRVMQLARSSCPWPARVNSLDDDTQLSWVGYDDLDGDQCDFQGIDWEDLGVTRRDARERRLLTYANYVNVPGSDRWAPNLSDVALPCTESFFRFRRMDIKRDVHLSHFQLRNVFASTSHSRVFYPAIGSLQQFNPMSGHGRAIMKISSTPTAQVSTLAAGYGILVAGSFGGEYILRHLDSGEPEKTACHEGVISSSNSTSGITNHVAVHQARTSSVPLAAFASNDNCFRVLDIATETWLSQETLDFAPNCTALSPDGRLRVMVGDTFDVVITTAEPRTPGGQPEILHRLSGHRDYGFACDWADDGWTVATAFQDKAVKIWDARRLTDSSGNAVSVCTIRSEMAGVRSLRFSPIGSGQRVLVAAEEADFVNIIDAQTFRSKQTLDLFGELGGISFANGGQDLMVLCCDRTRGGILQLERCGQRGKLLWDLDGEPSWATHDWPRSMFTEEKRVKERSSRRRRKVGARLEIEPF
ncbi:WD40-repeat-containing domain protein [Achaetomium macrosporum]|uniref:WD40-repeat-containing domain protein n=1 Tax=Achaetomium macrosporum TaxID=79813 RepID=A0AAN7CKA3_9PEZI|nr:WD40-repeat-containing domain protein [Achaetomium macrosporum]